jgi:transglutaminase-like putative cysteine protease
MRLAIRHTTRYRFTEPVSHGLQRLRLTPKETQGQTIIDWTMEYEGAREELSYEDQHHNHVTLISVLGLVLYGLVVAVEQVVVPWAHRP